MPRLEIIHGLHWMACRLWCAEIKHKQNCANFLVLLPNLLVLFVPNSNVFNIWAHIQAYLCHKQYFSFIPILYCFERRSIRYIIKHGLSVKIWQRPLTKWSAASAGLLGTTCIWFPCCCVSSRMYRGTGAKCFCSVCSVLLSSFSSVH